MKTSETQMFKEIKEDILSRLKNQTDSRQASADEVRIAWLIGEIQRMEEHLKTAKEKVSEELFEFIQTPSQRNRSKDYREGASDLAALAVILLEDIININKKKRIN
jgi:hypothetical protein